MRARALVGLLALSCGKGPFLEGSLSELMDLSYEKVVVQSSEGAVAVRFIRPRGELGEDTVLALSIDLADAGFSSPVDLAQPVGDGGFPRGTLTRNVQDDPRQTFPAIERGTFSLDGPLESGKRLGGELRATFVNGVEPASGRTVFGTFQAEVP